MVCPDFLPTVDLLNLTMRWSERRTALRPHFEMTAIPSTASDARSRPPSLILFSLDRDTRTRLDVRAEVDTRFAGASCVRRSVSVHACLHNRRRTLLGVFRHGHWQRRQWLRAPFLLRTGHAVVSSVARDLFHSLAAETPRCVAQACCDSGRDGTVGLRCLRSGGAPHERLSRTTSGEEYGRLWSMAGSAVVRSGPRTI